MPEPDLTTPHGRYEYALETRRMADDLWDLIFPPWRWRRWLRLYREISRRLETSRAARTP